MADASPEPTKSRGDQPHFRSSTVAASRLCNVSPRRWGCLRGPLLGAQLLPVAALERGAIHSILPLKFVSSRSGAALLILVFLEWLRLHPITPGDKVLRGNRRASLGDYFLFCGDTDGCHTCIRRPISILCSETFSLLRVGSILQSYLASIYLFSPSSFIRRCLRHLPAIFTSMDNTNSYR